MIDKKGQITNGSSGNRTRVLGFEAQEDILYPMDPPILFVIQEDNHSGYYRYGGFILFFPAPLHHASIVCGSDKSSFSLTTIISIQ